MHDLTYVRLIGFTAGTLLMLFWMVVILGYRRQRNFERVFFFLCLALFFFYAGSLLALNAQLHYASPPAMLIFFSQLLIVIGLWVLPALLLHLNAEYAEARGLFPSRTRKVVWLVLAYAPLVCSLVYERIRAEASRQFDFLVPLNSFPLYFKFWLILVLLLCGYWQFRFFKTASNKHERAFHQVVELLILMAAFLVFDVHVRSILGSSRTGLGVLLALAPIGPLGALAYAAQKYNFLQIGSQRNLALAISVTFVAMLYLSVVRRVGEWLEPVFPPEATAAILVFVLVALFEPLQRLTSRVLKATAQTEFERAHRIMQAIQQVARLGNIEKLRTFLETWLQQQLELSSVRLVWVQPDAAAKTSLPDANLPDNEFEIRHSGRVLGRLSAVPYGAMLSGETRAAMEFLSEQLPSAIDLCRAVEEKTQLERELAERERLALVGQTAASISHNLKNPLGSIKTILQVQLENPELPESMRSETKMVLDEIGRLSAKLNQLLQFSRPAVRCGSGAASCDARLVVEEAAAVLRPQADQRDVRLRLDLVNTPSRVAASPEALNDIASNLLVNALEAIPAGGHITVSSQLRDHAFVLNFEDDGPGIPESLREKILQPFFTTKSQGTGLGLAIVARRVAECDGRLTWQSPVKNGKGTRFEVTLPVEQEKKE